MPTKTTKKNTPNLAATGQPKILQSIDELKKNLLGTDREDHWQTVLDMEQDIKRALLAKDLTEHKGMQMLLDWMMKQVSDTNELLTRANSKDLSESQRDALIERKDFVTALIKFLDPKGRRLAELRKELEYQLGEDEETDEIPKDMLEDSK